MKVLLYKLDDRLGQTVRDILGESGQLELVPCTSFETWVSLDRECSEQMIGIVQLNNTGAGWIRNALSNLSSSQVICISDHPNPSIIQSALNAGVRAFVDVSLMDELPEAINAITTKAPAPLIVVDAEEANDERS